GVGRAGVEVVAVGIVEAAAVDVGIQEAADLLAQASGAFAIDGAGRSVVAAALTAREGLPARGPERRLRGRERHMRGGFRQALHLDLRDVAVGERINRSETVDNRNGARRRIDGASTVRSSGTRRTSIPEVRAAEHARVRTVDAAALNGRRSAGYGFSAGLEIERQRALRSDGARSGFQEDA